MKHRVAAFTAAAFALAVSASTAHAQGPGQGFGRPGRRLQMLLNGITMTPQQQARVDSIVASYRAQMPLFTPGAPPDSASMARRRELMRQQDDAIRAVLAPEQQQIFDRNVEQMRTNLPPRPPSP